MAWSLRTAAGVLAARGEFARAARLFGAETAWRSYRPVTFAAGGAQDEADLEATRTGLGEAAIAAGWAEDQALTLEEAVAEALTDEPDG